jgi:uncharacterized protein
MNFTEQAITFHCAEEELLGILALPEQPAATGVLVIVGGPQYRVGSHRQFLLLSRALAGAGYPTMRFDYRGMGDSTGDQRNFEEVNEDISAAIDVFRTNCPQVERVVLWGLCDAASASLLYWDATLDSQVGGLVLLNPWVRSGISLARTRIKHYYGQRLLQVDFWRKLLTGNLGLGRAIGGFVDNLKAVSQKRTLTATDQALPFQKKMARGLQGFPGQVLLLLSGNDYTAKEFLETLQADTIWAAIHEQSKVTRTDIPSADHTFSTVGWRGQVEEITKRWLETRAGQ